MYHILYLSPGPAPPIKESVRNQFFHLSKYFSGDILSPMWGKRGKSRQGEIQEITAACGRFQFHPTYSLNLPDPVKILWDLVFFVFKGIFLHYSKGHYDAIIAYGPFKTGLAAYLLKLLTGSPLIVEVPGNPKKSFAFEDNPNRSADKLKRFLGKTLTPFILKKADHVKLLYPEQLNNYVELDKNKQIVFFDFVPISSLKPNRRFERFILFLGYPWFLKGVDILIEAFQYISDEFPDYRLKVVGHCPNKTYFQNLIKENDRIELCNAVFFKEAMDLMSRCSLFVLPSRTEAMGRVLLEAMACKKPIIASRVDGIPHYIKHGFNGLLFEPENAKELAAHLSNLLRNPEFASKLADNGYHYVHDYMSENNYVQFYLKMMRGARSVERPSLN